MSIRFDAWIVSDTHFGHSNIIKYAGRPFSCVEDMDETLISNWNKTVAKGDQVVFLGDFSLANAEKIRQYRSRLNGEIIIVLGNHDRNRNPNWWASSGFIGVAPYPIIVRDFFILSHEPVDWVSERLPVLNIHGHVHEKSHFNLENGHYNVSVENTGYAPVRLKSIMDKGYELAGK